MFNHASAAKTLKETKCGESNFVIEYRRNKTTRIGQQKPNVSRVWGEKLIGQHMRIIVLMPVAGGMGRW
jgi:hypothetical protein